MRYAIIILAFLFCAIKTEAQVYQAMPQAGYGPVKRMLIDSVLTIPIGISTLRNITGGRDTAQLRYQKSDSSVYVYSGSSWIKLGTGGGSGSADSTVFFTVYRADTMRANIYGSIPQPDTIYARYPVRISNDTIYLQQAFVDSVYNVSSADASRLVTTVYNATGSTITKGSVVYINGRHSSNLPTVALAQANDEANSYKTFALVENDITTSNSGTVIQAGRINNLNLPTSTYTDGDILYLSPTVAGGYTTTKPLAPNHIVKLGSVTRAHPTLGSIEIKIENGWQLDELSDVQIAAVPADSTLLQFSRVDSLWHDVSPVTVLGNRTWKTDGNSSVNSNYFLGSTNNASVRFRTNNTERLIIDSIGGMQMASVANNGTLNNALQLANTNNRSFFNISTGSTITNLTLKANNNAVSDSMVISDSGLIQPRTNASLWLKAIQTGNNNVIANRCAGCGSGSIFSANVGTNAPLFNMLSTGQMSINGETPASTAALDITSTSRGLLIPRMTTSQRNAISTPATGLIVWNTDDTTLNQYSGNTWRGLVGYNPSGTINYTAPTQTGSNANGIINLQQTWNTTGSPTAFRMNVTNTASSGASKLIDILINNSSIFSINNTGAVTINQDLGLTNTVLFWASSNQIRNTSNGILRFSANAGGAMTRIQFGGTTSSFPALGMSSSDLIVQDATGGSAGRLGIGSAPTSALSTTSFSTGYIAQTANYTVTSTDNVINCTSNTFTVTLPTAASITGRIYTIKNSGTGVITVATTSSQTIDGAATYSLSSQYKYVTVVSNGANWIITANN